MSWIVKEFRSCVRSEILLCVGLLVAFLLIQSPGALAEKIDFQLSNPILLTSLRDFFPSSEVYVSKAINGSIVLRADKGYGIMAVVQKMNLQDLNSDFRTSCFDYLKISQINGSKTTGEICGNSDRNSFVQPSFVDKTGQTKLTYVLHEKVRLSPFEGNYTNFNISFTPFTQCPEDAFPFGNDKLRPCSTVDSFSCIPVEYFCDGVVNCGFHDEFGLDEMYCKQQQQKPTLNKARKSTKTAKTIVATTTITTKKLKDEIFYFKSIDPARNKPYDPYVSNNDDDDESTTTPPYIIIIRMSNSKSGPLLILAFACVAFLVLTILVQIHRKAREMRHKVMKNKKGKFDAFNLINKYDEEADPVPSYEECLIVPTILHTENELPPLYIDVATHGISKCTV